MKRKHSVSAMVAAALMLAFAASAGAVDGTIEINQAKVLANGGFPYVIGAGMSGSYRLTGNLSVPASVDGIDVNVDDVTIDLNGFSIIGSGAGFGINSSNHQLTVENGTVTGFTGINGTAIEAGYNAIVRNVHGDSNGHGILARDNSVIEGCTANSNNGAGIFCYGSYCLISGNSTNSNNGGGITCMESGCAFLGNTSNNNKSYGLGAMDGTTGYSHNVLSNNNSGGAQVNNGTSMGGNLCNGSPC